MHFFLEIGLWVVCLNSLLVYWASARSAPHDRPWRVFVLANGLLAGFLLLTSRVDSALSAVSIGAFVSTVLIPSALASRVDRLLAIGQWRKALRCQTIRELLQPGRRWAGARQSLQRLARIQAGAVEEVLEEIRAQRAQGAPQVAVDMEILAALGAAGRWEEAAAYFEEHFQPEDVARLPGVGLHAVRAYGETAQYEKMRQAMNLLADSPAVRAQQSRQLLDLAGLAYLAYMGRHEDVAYLLRPSSGFQQQLPDPVRAFWLGVALCRAGEHERAKPHLMRASRASPRLERLAASWLDRRHEPLPPQSPDFVADHLLHRMRTLAAQPRIRGGSLWRLAPVTTALILVNLGIYLVLAVLDGPNLRPGTLVAAGGILKSAVLAGQYERILSGAFLHANWAHIGLNMLVLAVMGRVAEAVLGSARFFVVYVGSAVVSGIATTYLGSAPISVGASGAIFGIIGALVVVLKLGSPEWQGPWRSSLMSLMVAVALLSLLPGLTMKVIDNWAHLGGLAGGVLLGVVVWRLLPRKAAPALAVSLGLVVLAAEVAALLPRPLPSVRHRLGRVAFRLPASWVVQERRSDELDLLGLVSEARLVMGIRPLPKGPNGPRMLLDVELAELKRQAPKAEIEFLGTGPELSPLGLLAKTLHYRHERRLMDHVVAVLPHDGEALVVHLVCPRRASSACRQTLASLARQLPPSSPRVHRPAT